MKVLCLEKFGRAILQPLRPGQRLAAWAMPVAAAVEGDEPVAALIASFDMPAERGGPAQFDRRHDAKLGRAERCVMLRAIRFAVAAEYVRHFRPRSGHRRAAQKYCGLGAAAGWAPDAAAARRGSKWRRLVAIRR